MRRLSKRRRTKPWRGRSIYKTQAHIHDSKSHTHWKFIENIEKSTKFEHELFNGRKSFCAYHSVPPARVPIVWIIESTRLLFLRRLVLWCAYVCCGNWCSVDVYCSNDTFCCLIPPADKRRVQLSISSARTKNRHGDHIFLNGSKWLLTHGARIVSQAHKQVEHGESKRI